MNKITSVGESQNGKSTLLRIHTGSEVLGDLPKAFIALQPGVQIKLLATRWIQLDPQ